MDVLLNAVDLVSGRVDVPRAETTSSNDVIYNQNMNPPTEVECDQSSATKMAKDSSYHTQTISVASSEPSDDEIDDETTTTTSYYNCTASMNGDEKRINWRNDPKQSFSDCTIEVALKSTHDTLPHVFTRPSGNPNAPVLKSKMRTYHVHRSVLAYGHRRSLYFVKLFQKNYSHSSDDADEEQLDRTSRIYLTKDVAKAFPTLLDYLYSEEEHPSNIITSENVVQLHFLSKILQITCLRSDTEKFYEKDMTITNSYHYYTQAHVLNGQKIMKSVTTMVINNLSKIKLQSDLLTDFRALSLWKHVVQSKYRSNTVNESIQISTLIACFCKLHRKLLQKEDFIRLTDVRHMPVIHYQVALPLLEISKELRSTESTGTLNRLQIRCLDAFVQSWKVWMASPNFQQALSKLDVFELYYLLNSALNCSDEKAPLIQSIRQHQATMNGKKDASVTSEAPLIQSSANRRPSLSIKPTRSVASSAPMRKRILPPQPKAKSVQPRAAQQTPVSPPQVKSVAQRIPLVRPLTTQGPPRHMNVVSVNGHPPIMMNNQSVLLHPLQYQQILQHRENCWNDYRNMKRKQISDAPAPDPTPHQMAVAHATAMHAQHQQHLAKRFRPNNAPYPPPLPPNPYHPPPPSAPWYGWGQN